MDREISQYIPYYPIPTGPKFNSLFNRKIEFRMPKVPQVEPFPSNKGDLMTHQLIISRIMSSNTPYDSILLMHEMGTGKTCSSVAIMEQIRSEKNGFKKFIFVCANDSLRANFEAEFRGVCTKGDYDDTPFRKLGIRTMTYTNFVTTFKNRNNSLDDTVVVIDEAHNIKERSVEYRSILMRDENVKVILMSGTPMTDDPSGIAKVMNMIIKDPDQLLDTTPDFYKDLTDAKIKKLRTAFKGRVSYIKSMSSGKVTSEFKTNENRNLGVFKHFKLYASEMSTQQATTYLQTFKNDAGGGVGDVKDSSSAAYSSSLQSSNFVGPDGQFTASGFTSIKFNILSALGRKDESQTAKLAKLRTYSSKYADSVEAILEARRQRKNVFVFNLYVNGGGIELFGNILKHFDIARANNVSRLVRGQETFIMLTGSTTDKKSLIDRFNDPDNVGGDYIGVVLASDAISEGYTFKNIQVIDVHSPWFQYAKISQVIARGIRFGSHRELLKTMDSVNVEIYLRVSVIAGDDADEASSVDVLAYKIAEEKDVVVKRIERVIKEESIDALINMDRNRRFGMDGERECDYMDCGYKPYPTEEISDIVRDYSTSELYYGSQDTELDSKIITLFSKNRSLDFDYIVANTKSSRLPVVSSLCNIIMSTTVIKNGGKEFYLKEMNDIYYLTSDTCNYSNVADLYYLLNEVTIVDPEPVEYTFSVFSVLEDATVVDGVSLVTVFENNSVSVPDKEALLEKVLTTAPQLTTPQANAVRSVFRGLYGNIEGTLYSWYPRHAKSKNSSRVFRSGAWRDASDGDEEIIRNYVLATRAAVVAKVEKQATELGFKEPYYYGMYAINDSKVKKGKGKGKVDTIDTFKIFKYESAKEGAVDGRVRALGQACSTFGMGGMNDAFEKLGYAPERVPSSVAEKCNVIETEMYGLDVVIRDVNIK
jgi:hypothetical protein